MKNLSKMGTILLMVLVVVTGAALAACGGGGDNEATGTPTGTPTSTVETPQKVVINIGNLTDLTGPTTSADQLINYALNDLIEYYNENNLIPGAELKVINYDTTYDPSKFISGYEWLKEKGADLIFTPVPGAPDTLKTRLLDDKMVMFTPAAGKADLTPPGNIFMPTVIPEDTSYTILQWISENDWDYKTKGPARLGMAGWDTPYNIALHDGAEKYIDTHTDQFQLVARRYTPLGTFNWGAEAEVLKDCDYIMPPIHLANWVRDYSRAGYETTYIGTGAQAAFFEMLDDANVWPQIDGMILFGVTTWWNDNTEIATFMNELVRAKHPDEADEIIRRGSAYGAVDAINIMMEIIRNAAEAGGAEAFDSDTLIAAAESYTQMMDGLPRVTFSKTKRAGMDYLPFYRADGEAKDLFMIGDKMYPVIREP